VTERSVITRVVLTDDHKLLQD